MPENDKKIATTLAALRALIDNQKSIEQYLQDGSTWADSQLANAMLSEKKAWRVASVSAGIALLLIIALIALLPLKSRVTEILTLDRSSGHIEPLQTVKETQITIDEAFTKKSINDFMLAHENYTFDTAELNYYTAAAFMTPLLQRQWEAYWDNTNTESPFNAYKNTTTVRSEINSITLHRNNDGRTRVATVRFSRLMAAGRSQISDSLGGHAHLSLHQCTYRRKITPYQSIRISNHRLPR